MENQKRPVVVYISGVPRFPAPGDKVRLGAPTKPVLRSRDAKNELVAKVRQEQTWALHTVVCRPVRKLQKM